MDGLGDLGLDIVYLGFDPAEGLEDRKGAAVGFGDGMVGCELARFEKLDYLSPPLSLQPTRMKQGVHLQMMRRPHSPGSTTGAIPRYPAYSISAQGIARSHTARGMLEDRTAKRSM